MWRRSHCCGMAVRYRPVACITGVRYYTGHMDGDIRFELRTTGAAETEAFGERLGRRLRGGEVIELSSDLGGGKTTLVRGLARGAGTADHVASPTFTVGKVYEAGALHIHHFDFYRLPVAGMIGHELADLLEDASNVVVMEWTGIVQDALPAERITITIERQKSGEDDRLLSVRAAARFAYLFDDADQRSDGVAA